MESSYKFGQPDSLKVFWTGAYFVASCGGVTIEQLKRYVEEQDSPDS